MIGGPPSAAHCPRPTCPPSGARQTLDRRSPHEHTTSENPSPAPKGCHTQYVLRPPKPLDSCFLKKKNSLDTQSLLSNLHPPPSPLPPLFPPYVHNLRHRSSHFLPILPIFQPKPTRQLAPCTPFVSQIFSPHASIPSQLLHGSFITFSNASCIL